MQNVSQKLISSHLISGTMKPGSEIGLKIDQVLLQDATGTLVMLELEAFNLNNIKPEIAVQYVDHNLLQTDYKNMDDHIFYSQLRHALDTGSVGQETELAMLYTWSDLVNQGKPYWVQTVILLLEVVLECLPSVRED